MFLVCSRRTLQGPFSQAHRCSPGLAQLSCSQCGSDWVFSIGVACAFSATSPESPVANSSDFLTSQISAPCIQGQLFLLLQGPPMCDSVFNVVFWFLFFNETLKDSSCLAQPLRKVSNSYICLFYIKLSNVFCMFFSVRNGGGAGDLHINSPGSTICYFFNYYFLSYIVKPFRGFKVRVPLW